MPDFLGGSSYIKNRGAGDAYLLPLELYWGNGVRRELQREGGLTDEVAIGEELDAIGTTLQALFDGPIHRDGGVFAVVLDLATNRIGDLLAFEGEGASPRLDEKLLVGLRDAAVEGLLPDGSGDVLRYGEVDLDVHRLLELLAELATLVHRRDGDARSIELRSELHTVGELCLLVGELLRLIGCTGVAGAYLTILLTQAVVGRLKGVDLYDVVLEDIAQGRYLLGELADALGAGGLIALELLLKLLDLSTLGEELADE